MEPKIAIFCAPHDRFLYNGAEVELTIEDYDPIDFVAEHEAIIVEIFERIDRFAEALHAQGYRIFMVVGCRTGLNNLFANKIFDKQREWCDSSLFWLDNDYENHISFDAVIKGHDITHYLTEDKPIGIYKR